MLSPFCKVPAFGVDGMSAAEGVLTIARWLSDGDVVEVDKPHWGGVGLGALQFPFQLVTFCDFLCYYGFDL